jgi:sigma-E factor negative regulatory protein RseC
MIEEGVVEKVKNNLAFVRIEKSAKCEGCKACAFGGKRQLTLPCVTEVPCAANDRVLLRMPEGSFAGASLLLFLVPLVCLLIGFMIGAALGELYMLLIGFGLAIIGAGVSVLVDRARRHNPKYVPVVFEKILSGNTRQSKERELA